MYYAVLLLTERVNYNIDIIAKDININKIIDKINIIYKEVKKNEKSPNMDYLFANNTSKTNLEKTVEKLDKMNNMNIFIPRT